MKYYVQTQAQDGRWIDYSGTDNKAMAMRSAEHHRENNGTGRVVKRVDTVIPDNTGEGLKLCAS